MAYTLNIDGDEFVANASTPDISDAIAKVGRGHANFFIVLDTDYENVFMQTGYPQSPEENGISSFATTRVPSTADPFTWTH